jgi:hypothetical protein
MLMTWLTVESTNAVEMGLTGAAAFPVVGDTPGVGAQVAVELAHRLE